MFILFQSICKMNFVFDESPNRLMNAVQKSSLISESQVRNWELGIGKTQSGFVGQAILPDMTGWKPVLPHCF